MSNVTSASSIVIEIQNASVQLVRYFPMIMLIFGTFGNILNVLIFTQKSLRSNSCANYFLASTIVDFVSLYFGYITRIFSSYNINPSTSTLAIYCKFRTYFTYVALSMSSWFTVLACCDRFASSSQNVRIRSLSRVKIAKRAVCITVIIVSIIYGEMFYCFETSVLSFNCLPKANACMLFNDFNLLITYSLLPPILMLSVGILTIKNIRLIRRISPTSKATSTRIKIKDRQLMVMLSVQVTCIALLSLPISVQKIYSDLTLTWVKSVERQQIENFLSTLVVLISLMNSSTSFYIYTLTGKVFRKELKRIVFYCLRKPIPLTETTVTGATRYAH
ncbi:unnamed protein product [Didymodactylos carnosus]|uniref:G-protein coupled receptors family 1 profile domain-containing protein n=1 Tax=Didymodactylos carnosus TaxID=1234261 RepID=A0A814NK69_9BILA|nr:unnamed protein product [Didymodactylos carnosus]CAF1331234.1 unnamed protein product [Didymodactylos carnosus]CAF3858060.1 unnamed protein product [Didymodactylos carnosus]CAF4142688.1 unnamed protein product [Didymodactylos carnosus]